MDIRHLSDACEASAAVRPGRCQLSMAYASRDERHYWPYRYFCSRQRDARMPSTPHRNWFLLISREHRPESALKKERTSAGLRRMLARSR